MQNHYNLIYREEEREMMPTLKVREITSLDPMCARPATAALVSHPLPPLPHSQHFGVGSIPWSPLARGALTRPLGERTIRADNDLCVIHSASDLRKRGFFLLIYLQHADFTTNTSKNLEIRKSLSAKLKLCSFLNDMCLMIFLSRPPPPR